MGYLPKGKHVTINPWDSKGLAICDGTGFVHLHEDLVQQMEWRGNGLVWTGILVGKDYVDEPNEQLRPPDIEVDPVPITDARPQFYTPIFWNTIFLTWNELFQFWNSIGSIEDGIPAQSLEKIIEEMQNAYFGAW